MVRQVAEGEASGLLWSLTLRRPEALFSLPLSPHQDESESYARRKQASSKEPVAWSSSLDFRAVIELIFLGQDFQQVEELLLPVGQLASAL